MGLPANSPQREHRNALQILRSLEAANSPGKANKKSPSQPEEALFIGFAGSCLLFAEEEGYCCQEQESGITGVASAAAAAARGYCLDFSDYHFIFREEDLRLVYFERKDFSRRNCTGKTVESSGCVVTGGGFGLYECVKTGGSGSCVIGKRNRYG